MRHKRLGSQLPNADLLVIRQGMVWRNHKDELVQKHHDGA